MDPEVVTLRPNSRPDRTALIALLDLGDLLAEAPLPIEQTRVIGGHMVAIHVARHGLDLSHARTTADTDFGLGVNDLLRLGLTERFSSRDYRLRAGHRFYRQLGNDRDDEAVVDVLVPTYTSRSGGRRRVGDIVTFKTPGLAELLLIEPLLVRIKVDFSDGTTREAMFASPDERGALFIKVLTWDSRRRQKDAGKDAFDIWRCLEMCRLARVGPNDWPELFGDAWKQILQNSYRRQDHQGCLDLA